MSEKPDWAIVLHELHEGQLATDIGDGDSFTLYGLTEPLREEIDLTEE